MIKLCKQCNKKFGAKRRASKFCSTLCRDEGKRIHPKIKVCPTCKQEFEIRQNKFCSKKCFGLSLEKEGKTFVCLNCEQEFTTPYPSYNKGQMMYCRSACVYESKDYRAKRSEIAQKSFKGEKSHFWKGGVTPIHRLIRESAEYDKWRKKVFKRDGYTCVWCGQKGNINADHILPFSTHARLRFDINNGRTLCVPCHKKTPTYAGRALTYQK